MERPLGLHTRCLTKGLKDLSLCCAQKKKAPRESTRLRVRPDPFLIFCRCFRVLTALTALLCIVVNVFSAIQSFTDGSDMEDRSRNSMMERGNSSDTRTTTQESPEDSSWTMYLQDFMITNSQDEDDEDRSSFSSYGYENCSIISDAASSVTRKFTINGEVLGFGVVGGYNRSGVMIKRKPKEALLDDALEDTASSPVNSPKVCNLSQPTVEPTLQKDYKDIPNAEKGSTSGRVDERNESGFIGRESDCAELKKRGLCLVPFSVVANYFG